MFRGGGIMREGNTTLKNCHDLIWEGGQFNPIESWEQLVLFLLARKKISREKKTLNAEEVIETMKGVGFSTPKLSEKKVLELIEQTPEPFDENLYSGDVREQLLSGFLRKDLGQFFTPKFAIDLIVNMIPPENGMLVGDFCMGPGRFLTSAREIEPTIKIYGIDINQDMVEQVKAEIIGLAGIEGEFEVHNTMTPWPKVEISWFKQHSFHRCYTNIPFGVKSDDKDYLSHSIISKKQNKVPSEVLLLEKHLEALRPDGQLGIVVPDSILSNFSLRYVRDFIIDNYTLNAVISLPVHTFSHSDTVVKASALIITNQKPNSTQKVFMASLNNIGYDSRGYDTESDVDDVLANWKNHITNGTVPNNHLGYLRNQDDLRDRMTAGKPLERNVPKDWDEMYFEQIVESPIQSGRTPGKTEYVDSNFKILKVRDLSPVQIDWNNSNKGLVSKSFFEKSEKGRIREGDILIINAAHHKSYIGKNVNIVENIPERYKDSTMCSGEIMIIRIDDSIVSPYFIQNWLKTEDGYNLIQEAVRGQTAHLYPQDVAKIALPIPTGKDELEVRVILDEQKGALIRITKSVEEFLSTNEEFQKFWKSK
jgi:type I restriction enzyme M protein